MEVMVTATATNATHDTTTTSIYHAETHINEPHISSSSASDPDQQRGSHKATADTTSVTINYAEPPGQRFLPVVLYESVTMVQIGEHNGLPVFEPVNDFLRSPEDGLRYHRTMDFNDVYHGPLDIAVWGRPVIGPLSDNQRWLINPLSYDPTRPRPQSTYELGEIPKQQNMELSYPPTITLRPTVTRRLWATMRPDMMMSISPCSPSWDKQFQEVQQKFFFSKMVSASVLPIRPRRPLRQHRPTEVSWEKSRSKMLELTKAIWGT
jgi:hypothetical protein